MQVTKKLKLAINGEIMEQLKVLNNDLFIKEQKNNILDNDKLKTFILNYKQANEKSKNYVSINKQATIFVDSVANNKTTNNDLQLFFNICEYSLKNASDYNTIINMDKLQLKKTLSNIYKTTLKLGVITETNDNKVTKTIALKNASGLATIKTMLLIMFSQKYTYIKPPKKEKQKKTLKKSNN